MAPVNIEANAASRVQPAPIWSSALASTKMVEEMRASGARACCWGGRRDSNPLTPEPQSADPCFWVLPYVADYADLSRFLCWWLPGVSVCCALSGVNVGCSVDKE